MVLLNKSMGILMIIAGLCLAGPSLAQPDEPRAADDADRDIVALGEALLGEDVEARAEARYALLGYALSQDEQVQLLALVEKSDQIAVVQEILQHHVLTQLREEEFAEADPEGVVVGFRFRCNSTRGMLEDLSDDLAAEFAWGAQVQSTTLGFPGTAYLRVNDVVVAIDGETLPQGTTDAQNFLVNTVSNHAAGQHVELTVLRDGEAHVIDVPLVRREAMAQMYATQGLSSVLVDPFLFLWEEAWAELLFEADREEIAQQLEREQDNDLDRPTIRPLPIRPR